MGAESLFCCFRNMNPACISFVGIAANIISFGFTLWGICDLFFIKKFAEVLYIILFVLLCICLVCFLIIFLFIILKRCRGSRSVNNFGRILCLLILGLSVLVLIILLIGFIIELVKHIKWEKDFYGKFWPNREWAALIVSAVIDIIGLIVMALSANALYKIFSQWANSYPISVNITQNSTSTIPNPQQVGIFPNMQDSGTNVKN